jgi:hypothetical protein
MELRLGGGGRIPWRRMLGIGVLLACLVPLVLVYRYFNVCAGVSSTALREFPAYGGARLAAIPNPGGYPEDCSARYISTADDTDTILAYYRDQLAAEGWTLLPEHTETNESTTYRSVMGLRGDLCYVVTVQHYQGRGATGTKQISVSVRNPDICRLMQQQDPRAP